jgi:cytidylate kinase
MHIPVITIDGPSGSGKGTISQRIATRLGWHMLDSGALYRLVALAAEKRGIALDDEVRLAELATQLDVRFHPSRSGDLEIILDNEEVSRNIRSEVCGNNASRVAALGAVRQALLARQRAFRTAPGLVADGRDMGTVVFPQADLKIFLTASAEARAKRRYKQLKEKGLSANLLGLSREIAERDERDMNRPVAPLKPAEDAVIVDSSDMTIEEVVDSVMQQISMHALG